MIADEHRLATYSEAGGSPRAGLVAGDRVHDLGPSLVGLLADEDAMAASVGRALGTEGLAVETVRLHAPVVPPVIWCAAANYTDHVLEMSGRTLGPKSQSTPYFFMKSGPHSVVGPGDAIRYPAASKALDWEAEIGVVIGRTTKGASVDDAMDAVVGYTIVNDLSARDLTRRHDTDGGHFGADWISAKSFDDGAPMGPWITPKGAIADPHALAIRLWVNDELQQDSSSSFMFWTIPEQIAYISRQITLRPGDVIATGTPAGCGRPRNIYMKPGDRVTIEIEGLGTLQNEVIAS